MWFGTREGRFQMGCRNKCDRLDMLHGIGLTGFDTMRLQPRFLRLV